LAATLSYFTLPADERALLHHLARHGLTLYPELVPPGFVPPRVDAALADSLDAPAFYLAAERFGPVIVHPVKRGRDRGLLEIEEVPSPVLHYERSLRSEDGELVSGRLWAELDVTDDAESRRGKPLGLRRIFDDVQQLFRKSWRRSEPKGFWVGVHAAAAWKRGELVLRVAGHKGREVGVWR
jgi:hypothetical protein